MLTFGRFFLQHTQKRSRNLLFLFFLQFLVACSVSDKAIKSDTQDVTMEEDSATSTTVATGKKGSKGKVKTESKGGVKGSADLKAGYADDNLQYNYFLNFLEKYSKQARHFPIPVEERIRIRVMDSQGRSVPNAKVKIYSADRKLLEEGMSYSDGSFFFFPSEYSRSFQRYICEVEFNNKQIKASIDRQGARNLDLRVETENQNTEVPMDIVFVLDTTASMGDEIASLLKTIELIHMNLISLKGVNIRFGMVLYKDRGDEYITRVIQPTEDVQEFIKELSMVRASGGGDAPEDLQTALRDSVQSIKWRPESIKLNFIITDAAPHLDYGQDYSYPKILKQAKAKGIKYYSIGTGGLDINGEYVLRQISQYTYAKYIFLTYGEKSESDGGTKGSVSHHTGDNFSTDKLESIVIRFAKEEYSHANGRPLPAGDNFFTAMKVEEEKKEETMQKLFEKALSQLVDFSGSKIPPGTPASILPIAIEDKKLNSEAIYLEEQMLFSFSKNASFQLIERRDLQKVYDEWKLGQRIGIAEENALKVGKLVGAKILLISRLYQKKDKYELYVKLLSAETGEILSVTKMVIDSGLF